MHPSMIVGVLLFVAAASGCDSPKPPVTAPPPTSVAAPVTATPPTATPTAPTETPTTSPSQRSLWVGSWSSASCGERKYERRLELKADKTFTAQDLVSPCPPKVACVWSGIVYWSGTWAVNEKGILLTKTTGGRDPSRKVNTDAPLQLVWDRAASAPAELSEAGAPCPYAKSTTDNVAK